MAKAPAAPEAPAAAPAAPFGVGLDIGTMNLVAARRGTEGVSHVRMRDAFLDLPSSAKKMLKLAKTSFVERDDDAREDDIAVIRVEDSITIKRRRRDAFGLRLLSSNPVHEDIVIRAEEARDVAIVGRVVGVYRALN